MTIITYFKIMSWSNGVSVLEHLNNKTRQKALMLQNLQFANNTYIEQTPWICVEMPSPCLSFSLSPCPPTLLVSLWGYQLGKPGKHSL